MNVYRLLLLLILCCASLYSFPGDQVSLSCIPEDPTGKNDSKNIQKQYKSEAPYTCPSADFPDADACKENNKKLAMDRVKKIVLDRHDTSKHFTMLIWFLRILQPLLTGISMHGTPINAMGEWAFHVRLIDARGKNSVKQIRFVSGL